MLGRYLAILVNERTVVHIKRRFKDAGVRLSIFSNWVDVSVPGLKLEVVGIFKGEVFQVLDGIDVTIVSLTAGIKN